MKQKPSVADFQKMIEQLAELLTKGIRKGLREAKKERRLEHCRWKSAFLDARWISDGDGLGWKYKLRIELPDGKWFGIFATDECKDCIDKIGTIKNEVFPDKWYGLKITIYRGGKYQYELNHDPECYVNDPQWYYT
jgi:hypothetical protein